ncbi:hypothetical protein [Mucilaginibacter aquatilis]|uniref:Uncharacterized protein n=1 Tax=Mucilaginibacter aquatilis TaxID=1517760 RepID=A0A6I4IBJ7_9SPHI|nr:hypothetical protein [Mucilaginibacter aquatilis]MVN92575.1 hypothetical protein [Mucilaginibacter aquatilis]
MAQWNENNDPANQDDYPETNLGNMQEDDSEDAAKFNSVEQEQAVDERIASENNVDVSVNNEPAGDSADINNNIGEELGGITNLSLDQLKKEGDPEGDR